MVWITFAQPATDMHVKMSESPSRFMAQARTQRLTDQPQQGYAILLIKQQLIMTRSLFCLFLGCNGRCPYYMRATTVQE